MEKLYIVIPAYNESENIDSVVNQWYPIIEKYNCNNNSRLVIINDGSKDDTLKKLKKIAKNKPLLTPLDKKNGGHGSSVLFGYRYAIKNKATWIFQTDSDGQTNPDEFHQFWKLKNKYDAIIGDRQSNREDGISRKFVENVLRHIIKHYFNVSVPDTNAPFRLMKTKLVAKYINKMPKNYNLPNVMLTTYFAYFHENTKFIKVSFKSRQAGINTINIKKIFKIGKQSLTDFKFLRNHINE